MNNTIDANALLAQMRIMAAKAQGLPATPAMKTEQPAGADFSSLLKGAVQKVNENQKIASNLATRFEQGDKSVDIAEVMVAMQKATVSFQAATQVRNRLVSAYQDIMNMPI